jgi:hypothetical protein
MARWALCWLSLGSSMGVLRGVPRQSHEGVSIVRVFPLLLLVLVLFIGVTGFVKVVTLILLGLDH